MICTISQEISQDALTETFNDVERLIRKICYSFLPKYNWLTTFDELYSEAYLAFAAAYQRFDHSKGRAFTTLLVHYVRGSLQKFLKKESKYYNQKHVIEAIDGVVDIDQIAYHKPQPDFWRTCYSELTDDAKHVVNLCFRTPSDLQLIIDSKGGTTQNIHSTIKHHIIKKDGWKKPYFKTVVDEIFEALQ